MILKKIFILLIMFLCFPLSGRDTYRNKDDQNKRNIHFSDLSLEPLNDLDSDLYFVAPLERVSLKKKNKTTELKIVPTDDLYKLFEGNNYRVLETLKSIDLTRPPIKTELKIRF